jgi:hypothetical protein
MIQKDPGHPRVCVSYEGARSVFWIHCGSIKKFVTNYGQLGTLAQIPELEDIKENDMLSMVKGWLEGPDSGNWVPVLDNADNKLDFYPECADQNDESHDKTSVGISAYIPRGRTGIVAITTRDMDVAYQLADVNVISKKEMDVQEAEALFRKNYPRNERSIGHSGPALLDLLNESPLICK